MAHINACRTSGEFTASAMLCCAHADYGGSNWLGGRMAEHLIFPRPGQAAQINGGMPKKEYRLASYLTGSTSPIGVGGCKGQAANGLVLENAAMHSTPGVHPKGEISRQPRDIKKTGRSLARQAATSELKLASHTKGKQCAQTC
eukprot:1153654-Pelagomonas_calceolata.AAC.1